ncbi:MAG TPA: dTDP-4-dehydrorhamnose reductase [Chitinophagaceae bacterium]|nr:dTDP-4-dehydrorhamnose reductase [Chitinophagaceae bacterium]
MATPVVLVTGANGQLGSALRSIAGNYPGLQFLFVTHATLPLEDAAAVHALLMEQAPAYCINCAAYTAVDKAETEREQAMLVNANAAGILAAACKVAGTKFIHVSTDYVFAGNGERPYKEADATAPVNYYGATKLAGEQQCQQVNAESIIVRTSWVYSAFGNNFVKTMLRLMRERTSINVVNDQLGSPTYAIDLAEALLSVIEGTINGHHAWVPGIYHYSNEGIISWFDFAAAIQQLSGSNCTVQPIPSSAFPTPAKRPAYSAMDKGKIKKIFGLHIPDWQQSLLACIRSLQ